MAGPAVTLSLFGVLPAVTLSLFCELPAVTLSLFVELPAVTLSLFGVRSEGERRHCTRPVVAGSWDDDRGSRIAVACRRAVFTAHPSLLRDSGWAWENAPVLTPSNVPRRGLWADSLLTQFALSVRFTIPNCFAV